MRRLNRLLAGGPYRGQVIDAETKAPLAGAVVLVYWLRHAPGIGHPGEGFLDAEEVLTDSQGEFVVGRHPPWTLIPGTWVSPAYITIFFPGYGFFPVHQISPPPSLGRDRLSRALEQFAVVELAKLKTREARLQVAYALPPSTVPRARMPNLIRLIDIARQQL